MNKKMSVLLIISLLMLVGCQGDNAATTTTSSESPYLGGSKGITAEFLDMGVYNDETGIEEIFEDETFPIEVEIKNQGEEDVAADQITVTLKGIALGDFEGIVEGGVLSNSEVIEKITEYNPEGGEATLDFTSIGIGDDPSADAKYDVPLSGAHYDVGVFGEVVYEYKTYASVPKICFKENLQDDNICDVDESKTVYSSGAPIQVKSAEEKRAGTGKIAVEFKVENVGGGDVTIVETDFNLRYDQLSFVSSDAELWECKAGGRINEGRFDSAGKMTIVCKLKAAMDENTLYTKELDLTLNYKYRELIQREIRIREQ